jgi:hypothetical protein
MSGAFWVPVAGGRWRIDWQRINRSGNSYFGFLLTHSAFVLDC